MSFLDAVKKSNLRVLTFDIENAPATAHVWGMFKQNIGLSQLVEPARVFGFGGKWYDEKLPFFFGEGDMTHDEVIKASHDVLNQADILVTYNGIGFDLPHMNREFAEAKLPPGKASKTHRLAAGCA